MTQKKAAEKTVAGKQGADIPANLPLELIPAYIWWKANRGEFLKNAAVVLVVAGAVFGWRVWRDGRTADANREFAQAGSASVDDLEGVVAKYGSTKIGNAARLRLAMAYFNAGKHEEALQAYEACLKKGAPDGFAEVAQMGRAYSLEAVGNRLDDALAAFRAFAEDKATQGHFLAPQARMGMARVLALQGKKDEAKNLLEILKAEKADDPMVEMAVAALEGVVNRYEPRAVRSLFERADEAARELTAPVAPATGAEAPDVN